MDVRPYEPQDEERQSDLDLHFTAGPGIRVRRKYAQLAGHGRMHRRCHTFVADDGSRIVGILSAAIKDVRLEGHSARAAYLFGLRVAPEARRHGIASALYARAEQAARDDGAAAVYAIVMTDNASVMPLTRRFALQPIGRIETRIVPVTRQRPGRVDVTIERSAKTVAQRIDRFFETCDLFAPGPERYPAACRFAMHFAQQGSSFAAVTQSSHSAVLRDVAEFVPACLRPLRRFLDAIRPLVALPHLPAREQTISTWWIGEPVLKGPEAPRLLRDVFRHIHNKAQEENVHWLTMPMRPSDRQYPAIREAFSVGRLARLLRVEACFRSRLLFKPLVEPCAINPERLYLDTRDF
ncbi:MAG: GNAT family N-acetyltransferase [Planctomycetota bacterium]|nr:GNAT family N-acetyltransferase [Planctomycetota bacterium]